ncbi:L-serine ammonia-lyase [Sphingomonas desiccabilis]|uniref:L-serine dehydratase n=1 Tax=Sphingomonas desiccabilis TaxID=429134 RepID=A0A4Q2J018_9SPHN|nr:L-serine ammonia-lyase [Sphingomonas desiccabilis]MBB3910497.1 L-serine dehydratase [Sphingomonas desiccabilis]RXZ35138.1 L-serine ammonia-lyase [Sphingomonas desiccabilis]
MPEAASQDTPSDLRRSISVTELFTIGIGPSSSHTVGPMRAAHAFAEAALEAQSPVRVRCELFGSLSLTGRGHATDNAVVLGLAGHLPDAVDPDAVPQILHSVHADGRLKLGGRVPIAFSMEDVLFSHAFLPGHPNAVRFTAVGSDGSEFTRTYFSIGGGVVVEEGAGLQIANAAVAHPFASGAELLELGQETGLSIGEIVLRNECAWRSHAETDAFLDAVRGAMLASIERGCATDGILPGGLNVRRRAKGLHGTLTARSDRAAPASVMEWISLWALAVNEENAAGGRVVTAPTNGAAGVIPAVLKYYESFVEGATPEGSRMLLATAAAIGFLYKKRASISAAEMGCQGEVGVACSMAAAGLAAVLGGTNQQIENAAEIGMEHNLGLTCDPIGGLVQVPCIERNTMGAVKAVNAAYLALHGDGSHIVPLDAVIETMRQTGDHMRFEYKETSLGGLAVNVVAC